MAIINCWACKQPADEEAKECPHCHATEPGTKPNTLHALLTFAAILALGALVFFAVYRLPR